jgi:small subunit ribosomal protein S2
VIPGNDDAIRSGTLMCRVIADAVAEGRYIASRRSQVVASRSMLDEERIAAEQAEARRLALAEAKAREARLAGAPTAPGTFVPAQPEGVEAEADVVGADPGVVPSAAEAPGADVDHALTVEEEILVEGSAGMPDPALAADTQQSAPSPVSAEDAGISESGLEDTAPPAPESAGTDETRENTES